MRILRRMLVAVLILGLPGVVLAPVWRLGGLGAGEDDILYYFPTRTFFHDTIAAHDWPWFNPWTGLGRPFMADPQTAVWYPTTWLFAALPPVQAYPLSLWLHYSLALWGMYRLLRSLHLGPGAALFGAIAFGFSGFMLAHRAHFSMQHAAAWTPWVFWALLRLAAPDSLIGRRLALAAIVCALQCLAGHVQIALLTAAGSLVFLVARGGFAGRSPAARVPEDGAGWSRAVRLGRVAGRWLAAWVCAAGLFAVQWVPTFEYVRLTTRTQRTYLDFVENSWHPVSLIGATAPMLLGQRTPNFFAQPYWGPSHQVEQFPYIGLLPLVLAGLALRHGWRRDRRRRPWVILGILALLLALGLYGPICPWLYYVPGSSLFRVPARAMLLVHLAVAALAATTFHDLAASVTPQRARLRAAALRWTRRPVLVGVLLVVVPLVLVVCATPFVDASSRAAVWHALRPWNPAVFVPLATSIVALLVLSRVVRAWQRPWLTLLLTAVTVLDLGVIGWTIDVPAGVRSPVELTTPRAPADWMDIVRESGQRLWVVTGRHGWTPGEYVDPIDKAVADTNMLREIPTLTDYGPLQPRAVVQRWGFKPWGETDDAPTLLTDIGWSRLSNVGWILLCDPQWPEPTDGELVSEPREGWRLYRNPAACGPAAFDSAAQPGAVQFLRESTRAFTVVADTWPERSVPPRARSKAAHREEWPLVAVAELALPGWTATIAGKPVPTETIDGLWLGVRVPPGERVEINWIYSPPGLEIGVGVTAVSVAALVAICVLWWRSAPAASVALPAAARL